MVRPISKLPQKLRLCVNLMSSSSSIKQAALASVENWVIFFETPRLLAAHSIELLFKLGRAR